jgi:tRNA-modifying protein YgfZ
MGMETATEPAGIAKAYAAARESAIVVDRSDLGMLKFSGETRLDLLQRMSTGDVANLQSGEGAATLLTTDIGRMVDRLLLYASSDAVYALTGENNADNVARYLMRFVFFQDDFHIEDLSAETAVYAVYGQQAEARLRALFGNAVDLALHHWRERNLDGATVYVHRTDAVAGDGYFVMCRAEDAPDVMQRLVAQEITLATAEAFDYLRIESGLPRFGREITGDYIPLEAGLWRDVSFNKGCYIGQEIIARMESRGRLAKQLLRLQGDGSVSAGADVERDGRSVGTITSAADGPAGSLALAYVKTRALDDDEGALTTAGTPLRVIETVRL